MTRNTYTNNIELILCILLVIGIVVLACYCAAVDKNECIAQGGKYITGYVGEQYSTFCIK